MRHVPYKTSHVAYKTRVIRYAQVESHTPTGHVTYERSHLTYEMSHVTYKSSHITYAQVVPHTRTGRATRLDMGWLRLVESIKLWVSFAKEPYTRAL